MRLRQCSHSGDEHGQPAAERRLHVLPRRNVHFSQPFERDVTAPGAIILLYVAHDVGELERKAKIARPVERRLVVGRNAHHHRHHAADDAGDVIAIAHQIGSAAGPPILRIEREPGDQIAREGGGHGRFGGDDAKRVERRIADDLAGKRLLGLVGDLRQARLRIDDGCGGMAMILPVGEIVAAAAPGVEQPGAFARLAIEQPAGGGEALRSARNRFLRGGDDRVAAGAQHARTPAFAGERDALCLTNPPCSSG